MGAEFVVCFHQQRVGISATDAGYMLNMAKAFKKESVSVPMLEWSGCGRGFSADKEDRDLLRNGEDSLRSFCAVLDWSCWVMICERL